MTLFKPFITSIILMTAMMFFSSVYADIEITLKNNTNTTLVWVSFTHIKDGHRGHVTCSGNSEDDPQCQGDPIPKGRDARVTLPSPSGDTDYTVVFSVSYSSDDIFTCQSNQPNNTFKLSSGSTVSINKPNSKTGNCSLTEE